MAFNFSKTNLPKNLFINNEASEFKNPKLSCINSQ